MLVFSESFKQFIKRCDNKIAYHLASYIESNYPVYDLVFTDEFINYITFRNDGTISYLPKGKEHKENSN